VNKIAYNGAEIVQRRGWGNGECLQVWKMDTKTLMLSGTSEVADLMLTLAASKGIFANMSSHLAADGAL